MKRNIPTNTFDSIFKNLWHLKLQEDEQALLAMMIKFAHDNDSTQPWSWLNFATILYAARKNAGTKRWFYNTKDGTRLTKEQLTKYLVKLKDWEKNGWISIEAKPYDNTLSRNSSWSPLPSPKQSKNAAYYTINLSVIAEWGAVKPTTQLF